MNTSPDPFDLRLYYQDKVYNCSELLHMAAQQFTAEVSVLSVESENVFSTLLALVQGYTRQQCVFPVSKHLTRLRTAGLLSQSENFNHPLIPEGTALAVATSGSQAEPKIALISFNNIRAHCRSFYARVPVSSDSLWLNCLPLSHIAGLMIVYRCALGQAAMLLHQGFNAQQVWQDMFKYPVTHISLVPAMLAQLLDIQERLQIHELPESLGYVIVGGDRLSASLYQRAMAHGWPLLISYGMTEATSTIALGKKVDQLLPLKGFKLCTDDDKTLYIKGDMVFSHYLYKEPSAHIDSSAYKKPHEDSSCFDNGWFKTSDKVIIDQGQLTIIGRNDYMIISGGENLAPEAIEAMLLQAPVISDIAVGSMHHEIWGQTIVALVAESLTEKQLVSFKIWLKEHTRSACRPRFFIPVSGIPRTELGKIDRRRVQTIIDSNPNHSLSF